MNNRKIIRGALEINPNLEKILNHVRGNIGFVFTNGDLKEIRDLITENKVSRRCCILLIYGVRLKHQLKQVLWLLLMCLFLLVTLDWAQRKPLFFRPFL